MKSTVFPIDIETGEIPPGIQMTDEEDRKRRKCFAEKQYDIGTLQRVSVGS